MRPPEHWHLRRSQPRRWPWAFLVAGAAVLLLGVLVVRLWPGGGEAEQPAQVSNDCFGGADCAAPANTDFVASSVAPPKITGRAAAVIEASCGELLYGHNADLRLPPASLAKIATALVAVDRADLSRIVDVKVNSALLVASSGSTVMGLQPGQQMTVRDLLYGLLLPSGNDAAIAIAEGIGGSVAGFVQMMNDKAEELGLRNTNFTNPHGLDEPGLYSSAHDMALLGQALLNEPELAAIVRTKNYQPSWNGPQLWNGNVFLDIYPNALGVKIGYTEDAGQTIVAAAEQDGRRLIVSVLGAWDRYSDAVGLLDWAFAETRPACVGQTAAP